MITQPVSSDCWPDLVKLFEAHGNPNYCWCMTWRMSGAKFRECNNNNRKKMLKQKVRDGIPIGILGYVDDQPVGWCSVAPRETYGKLVRARSIKKIDDRNTWSIVCFFIKPEYQQQKFSLDLLNGAVDYARLQGAEVVEGYPVVPKKDENRNLDYNVSYRFMGYFSTFQNAGFQDVTPKDSKRTVVRYQL